MLRPVDRIPEENKRRNTVENTENFFRIGCKSDITHDIAKAIIESGAGLHSFKKRIRIG